MPPLLWLPRHKPYKYPQYSPLKDRPAAFRLVRLLPPLPTLFGNTLRIQLITVDNVSTCAYDTLSYTWGVTGKDPPNRRILVETPLGSRELRIYRPLEIALSNVKTDRPLFVDQICINQGDKDEKAHQVQMMREIYANCTRLLVWLGPATAASDQYMEYIRRVNAEGILNHVTRGYDNKHFMQVFDAVMDSDIPVEGEVKEDRDDVVKLIDKYGDSFPLEGAKDILSRTWFSRLWIIQEVCLAPTVLFVCGSQSLCFDCFRLGLLFFNTYNTHWTNHVTHVVPKAEVTLRKELLDLNESPLRMTRERKAIHHYGTRHSLYDIVINYNVNSEHPKIGATLAEDRIFGVMGMAEDRTMHGLEVKYTDTQKVFIDLGALLAKGNLDIMLFSQFPKSIAGLPSWAPDWSTDLIVPRGYMKLREPFNKAGGDSRGEPTPDPATNCLTARGIVVDAVSKVGRYELKKNRESRVYASLYYPSIRMYLGEIDEFLSQSRVPEAEVEIAASYIGDFGMSVEWFSDSWGDEAPEKLTPIRKEAHRWGQRLIDLAQRNRQYPLADLVDANGRLPWYWLPVSESEALQHWATGPISAIKTWIKAAGHFLCDAVGLISAKYFILGLDKYLRFRRRFAGFQFHAVDRPDVLARAGIDPDVVLRNQLSAYTDNLIRMIGQRVYLTEKGYVGTGPREMQQGDVLAVLFGMTCPIVLRKHTDLNGKIGWTYVGEAYCYGIMNGELLQDGEEVTFNII